MKTRIIVAAGLAALLGCSDSSGPSVNLGTIIFTYTGAGGGTYSVSAVAPASGSEPPASVAFAAGNVDTEFSTTSIAGSKPAGGDLRDFVIIVLDRTTVGSALVGEECGSLFDNCPGVMFVMDFDTEGESFSAWCMLTAGTTAITEMSATRAKGTFSGTGLCYDAAFNETPFTITNGTFDVALVAEL